MLRRKAFAYPWKVRSEEGYISFTMVLEGPMEGLIFNRRQFLILSGIGGLLFLLTRSTPNLFQPNKKGGKDDLYCQRLQSTFRNGGIE